MGEILVPVAPKVSCGTKMLFIFLICACAYFADATINEDVAVSPNDKLSKIEVSIESLGTPYLNDVFTAYLCNFLSACGQTSFQIVALKSAVPVVSIKGSALRTVYRYNKLSLSSVAFVTVCDVLEPAGSSNGLIYTWIANVAGVPDTTLVSTSKQASSYLISEYVLVSNVVYTIEVTI